MLGLFDNAVRPLLRLHHGVSSRLSRRCNRRRSLCTSISPCDGRNDCAHRSLPGRYQPSPLFGGSAPALSVFEACSTFSRLAAGTVSELSYVGRYIEVLQATSLPPRSAPIAIGWSDSCRAQFARVGRRGA